MVWVMEPIFSAMFVNSRLCRAVCSISSRNLAKSFAVRKICSEDALALAAASLAPALASPRRLAATSVAWLAVSVCV